MSSDATCEESSVRKGAGYDEAFGSSDESEDFSPSSERETLAQSPNSDEGYTKGGDVMLTRMTSMLAGMIVIVRRNQVEGPRRVQGITILLFFLRIGPSTSFYL